MRWLGLELTNQLSHMRGLGQVQIGSFAYLKLARHAIDTVG